METVASAPRLVAGKIEQTLSVVDRDEKVGEDEGDDGHELHEDVERGAGGVLEGVADGVADDGGLVGLGALDRRRVRRLSMYFLALSQAPPALDMKIAIRTPEDECAGEQAADGLDAEHDADDDGAAWPGRRARPSR